MDTITHFALGACVGELLATNKQLGKRALLVGGLAQLIPDIDFVFGLYMDPASNVLAHRGFTHSFLFALIFTALFAWAFKRNWGDKSISLGFWAVFLGLQILIHDILDAFNAYGTGWFEPFRHDRVSFNMLFVADPFFSLPLGIAVVFLVFLSSRTWQRKYIAVAAIGLCGSYLFYAIYNKVSVTKVVSASLATQGISSEHYFTTPTPFNNWLWYAVATDEKGSYVGYHSVFDRSARVTFEFFPRNDSLLARVPDQNEVEQLKRFAQGHYTVAYQGDTLLFNDLRFGQMIGWQYPRAGFVFHYYLAPPLDNTLVLQRGRFEGWDSAATRSLLDRIRGE